MIQSIGEKDIFSRVWMNNRVKPYDDGPQSSVALKIEPTLAGLLYVGSVSLLFFPLNPISPSSIENKAQQIAGQSPMRW